MTAKSFCLVAALLVAAVRMCNADPIDESLAAYSGPVRELDREEFLEGEPIWLCASSLPEPASAPLLLYALYGRDGQGAHFSPILDSFGRKYSGEPVRVSRGFELTQTFGFYDASHLHPVLFNASGIPAGQWEIRARRDTSRVLARIRVVPPPGSERSVRDGLARAARLAGNGTQADRARAAALYDAIYRRYPRTTYLSVIYWGEWGVRAHTRFANDPGRWIEEIFAHFHDSCFGVIALDRWVRDMGAEAAQPALRRLVGIYPDTPLSRAALRYL